MTPALETVRPDGSRFVALLAIVPTVNERIGALPRKTASIFALLAVPFPPVKSIDASLLVAILADIIMPFVQPEVGPALILVKPVGTGPLMPVVELNDGPSNKIMRSPFLTVLGVVIEAPFKPEIEIPHTVSKERVPEIFGIKGNVIVKPVQFQK
jgi:hypothetical protein